MEYIKLADVPMLYTTKKSVLKAENATITSSAFFELLFIPNIPRPGVK